MHSQVGDGDGDLDDDDDFRDDGETMLETFTSALEDEATSIDEFAAFKSVLCCKARLKNLDRKFATQPRKLASLTLTGLGMVGLVFDPQRTIWFD